MAQKKAIKLTDENFSKLANQYGIEDPLDALEPGLWLVTDFGVEEHFEIWSPEKVLQEYYIVRPLLNKWVEIKKRP